MLSCGFAEDDGAVGDEVAWSTAIWEGEGQGTPDDAALRKPPPLPSIEQIGKNEGRTSRIVEHGDMHAG